MKDEQRFAIEAACIRLQQRYGTLADRQDPSFAELFAPDACITLPGMPPFDGLDAIMGGQAEWRRSGVLMRHICTNFTIDVIDERNARGICYLLVFRHEPTDSPGSPPLSHPLSCGEYHDLFVRAEGRWLFRARELRWTFRGFQAA